MVKYECKIILCGPGVGKTYLAKHDNHFVDIDDKRARYKYNIQNISVEEFEKEKYNRGKTVNKDYYEYSIKLLNETITNNKIALISYQETLLNYIIENKIDYCLVYADISLRNEYKSRMEKRGNNKEFVYAMTNKKAWDEFFKRNENDKTAKYKIKLKEGQYLSSIKDYFI